MNPSKPESEGRFLGDYHDEKGDFVYRQMTTVAKEGGEGFVDYYTHRPGETDQVRKRSFVKPFMPWGWIFVTGAYLDDIDAAFWRAAYRASFFVLAMSVVLCAVVFVINRSPVRALGGSPEYAKTVVRATASGDLSLTIDSPADEDSLIGQIGLMQTRLRAAVADIQRVLKSFHWLWKRWLRGTRTSHNERKSRRLRSGRQQQAWHNSKRPPLKTLIARKLLSHVRQTLCRQLIKAAMRSMPWSER